MSKKLALLVGFLLTMVSWATFADDPLLTFGPRGAAGTLYARQDAFARRPGLVVIAETKGRAVLKNSTILKRTGGGLLISTAEPDSTLATKEIELRYSP